MLTWTGAMTQSVKYVVLWCLAVRVAGDDISKLKKIVAKSVNVLQNDNLYDDDN